MRRRRLIALGALGLVAAAVAAILTGTVARHDDREGCRSRPFDRRAWNADESYGSGFLHRSTRQRLADDLVTCRRLIGKRRSEVRALLGKPWPVDRHALSYDLGPPFPGSLDDSEYLTVFFDRRGRVASAALP